MQILNPFYLICQCMLTFSKKIVWLMNFAKKKNNKFFFYLGKSHTYILLCITKNLIH